MPYCRECGTKVVDGYSFCPTCGKALKAGEIESADQFFAQTNKTNKRPFRTLIALLIIAVLAVGAFAESKFSGESKKNNKASSVVNDKNDKKSNTIPPVMTKKES